jgi:hypothetical protein
VDRGRIDLLLRDEALASRLGENAREEAARSHSWDGVASSIGGIYEGLVRRSATT